MQLTQPADEKSTASQTARILLEVGAVQFRPAEPFILASGEPSPVYVDCRRIISFPKQRRVITEFMVQMIFSAQQAAGPFDNIAGGETAGIPFAALVAERMELPMSYIRKRPKGYGRNSRIEGVMEAESNVVLVEDLSTDGASKLHFVQAIRETGAFCAHSAVILGYGIFPAAEARVAAQGLSIHSLCAMRDLVRIAEINGRLRGGDLQELQDFMCAPESWRLRNSRPG
ncbi:MAG: orotate phosphoribosyltransferase [Rhodobacteraceae bacterium]|nr:orotate phosphoribosyltransferase [Paracoccaceae bacterium]